MFGNNKGFGKRNGSRGGFLLFGKKNNRNKMNKEKNLMEGHRDHEEKRG